MANKISYFHRGGELPGQLRGNDALACHQDEVVAQVTTEYYHFRGRFSGEGANPAVRWHLSLFDRL
ncbi:MAG TPA: hypothetical protein VF524_05175 [Polyangia bacterium]